MNYYVIIVAILAVSGLSYANAATIKQTMDGAMDLSIEYPDSVIVDRDFTVSVFFQNNGWEDKQDVTFFVESQNQDILATNQTIHTQRLSKGGSFGGTLEFHIEPNAEIGQHYLNAIYSQILLSNNEIPQPKLMKNIAIPLLIKDEPEILLKTNTPNSIFENAEFPFDVEIVSKDISIHDVSVKIIPPLDITVRGQTSYAYSVIEKNSPVLIKTQIITPPTQVSLEHKLPFEIQVNYVDDSGESKAVSQTIQILLRPRTIMEFTTEGGIWIGSFFLAPYLSIGTLIGIPAGTLFSLMIKRLQKKKRIKRKK